MQLPFTKMQSLGNDFVVLDGVSESLSIDSQIARRLADRHFGVGCDQVLLVQADDADGFFVRIFNRDGGESGQCGNGMRCIARFLHSRGLVAKDAEEIRVRTKTQTMRLILHADESVTVNMGAATFAPAEIPFEAARAADCYALDLDGETVEISALAIGNPHAVQRVDCADDAPVALQGALTECHARFPERVNAGFMQVVSRTHIRLRVFERGAGETLGCGSGACAAAVAGIRRGWLDSPVRVALPGGDCEVEWDGEGGVFLTGPANDVFCGVIALDAL